MNDIRIHLDLESARDLGSRFIPSELPRVDALDYHGECRPRDACGGNFYDFMVLPENRLAVSVGDVCGRGIGAAALMSGVQLCLRGLTALGSADIAGLVRELNRAICQTSPGNLYTTLFHAHLDPARRRLHYVNAGHEPALLIRPRAGRVHRLETTGTVLGLTDRVAFARRTLAVEPGDVLVAFTEGVTEAAVRSAAELYPDARAADLVARILDAAGASPEDQTVAVVRARGAAARILIEEEEAGLALAAA